MRSLATWAVVAGVGAIGAAATVDALRTGTPPASPERPPALVGRLQPCPEGPLFVSVRGDGGTKHCLRHRAGQSGRPL